MDLFLIYLWLKLDSVLVTLALGTTVGIFAVLLGGVVRLAARLDDEDVRLGARLDGEDFGVGPTFCKWHTRAFWVVCGAVIVGLALPSTKEVAILVGSSIALDVVKSPEGDKVVTLLRGKANEILDAELRQLTPKKGN